MTEQVVTTLVSKMKFEADNRPLLSFEKNLDRVFSKIDNLTKLAQKKINLKVGLDTKSLTAQLKVARNTKIVLSNIDVSKEAVTTTMAKLSEKLGGAKLRIENVSISIKSIAAQKRLMRDLLDATQIEVPVELRLRAAEKQLVQFQKKVAEKHKLYLTADISKHRLFQNIKKSLDYVTQKTQSMKLEPLISLKVDRAGLKKEIEDVLRQIERSAKIRIQLNGDISGQGGAGESSGQSLRRHALTGGVAGAAMHWGRGFVPGLGGAFAISQMNQMNQEYKGSQTALQAVSGADYGSNESFLKGISKEQGRNFRDLAPQFTQILAASKDSIGSQGTQDMFRGIMKYGTMMNLDQEAMKGSFRAIGQMFSKDKIQAEEAQGQFAERMPAGMQLLAKAHGTTVKQLREDMKDGKLDPKKLIPELGKIMENLADSSGGYAKALESTRVAQGRFNATFEESVILFADSGMDRALAMFFREGATQMERSTNLIKALGGAFEYLMVPIRAAMRLIGDFSEYLLPKLAKLFGISETAVVSFGAASLLAMTPWGRIGLIIAGVITALDDFSTYLKGGTSEFGKWMESLSPEKQQALKDMGTAIAGLASALVKLGEVSMDKLDKLSAWLSGFTGDGVGALAARTITDIANAITKLVNAISALDEKGINGIGDVGSAGVGYIQKHPLMRMYGAVLGDPIEHAKSRFEQVQSRFGFGDSPMDARLQGKSMLPVSAPVTSTINLTVNGVQGAEDMVEKIQKVVDDSLHKTWQSAAPLVIPQKK